jgi:radical SAM protein with 4Fe4S-binding SPASM domain
MADGAVSACPNLSRDFVQGNIKERPFTEMWEEGFEIFRDRRWMMNGPCAVCPEWNACLGNSLHTFDMKRKEPRICHFKMVRESKSFQ